MKKQAETLEQAELEKVTFSGIYFLAVGFLWQMMWQLGKVIDYPSMLRISKSMFQWTSIGIVGAVVTYLIGYMIFLETKKQIDSKGLLIKYFIGLLLGYAVAKIMISSIQ